MKDELGVRGNIDKNVDETPVIQAPETYNCIDDFDRWLHDVYIPATRGDFTECWGIFSAGGQFEKYYHVPFMQALTQEIEKDLKGKIMSHNHLTDSTFSVEDVKTWAGLKMRELRVVTATSRFSIKPRNGKWPLEEDVEKEMDRLTTQIKSETFVTITPHQLRDKCYKLMAKSGWFIYTKEKFV